MAYESIIPGDLEIEIKLKAYNNMVQLISDGSLTAADYDLDVQGLTLIEFRDVMNTNFAQFDTDTAFTVVAATMVMGDGDSWLRTRTKLATAFAALDAVINP